MYETNRVRDLAAGTARPCPTCDAGQDPPSSAIVYMEALLRLEMRRRLIT